MQIKDFILPNKRTVVCAKPETVIDCYRALRAVILCALKSECLFTGLETQLLLIKSSLIGLYKTIYNVMPPSLFEDNLLSSDVWLTTFSSENTDIKIVDKIYGKELRGILRDYIHSVAKLTIRTHYPDSYTGFSLLEIYQNRLSSGPAWLREIIDNYDIIYSINNGCNLRPLEFNIEPWLAEANKFQKYEIPSAIINSTIVTLKEVKYK